MIALLSGVVAGRSGNTVIVDVNGVGYEVLVSARTLNALGPVDSPVRLIIITQVREDAITLFGFADTDERDVFKMLTGVQGVGAKIGIAILSALSPGEALGAIVAGDQRALTRADGVGAKLAGRIVNELKDKAAAIAPALAVPVAVQDGVVTVRGRTGDPAVDDARVALLGLGYSKPEAEQLLSAALAQEPPPRGTAAIISAALRAASARAA